MILIQLGRFIGFGWCCVLVWWCCWVGGKWSFGYCDVVVDVEWCLLVGGDDIDLVGQVYMFDVFDMQGGVKCVVIDLQVEVLVLSDQGGKVLFGGGVDGFGFGFDGVQVQYGFDFIFEYGGVHIVTGKQIGRAHV